MIKWFWLFAVITLILFIPTVYAANWSIQTVDTTGYEREGGSASIALDSSNNPHISYYDSNNQDLKYAKWTGNAWGIQTVEWMGDVGRYPSIALDSSNNPHISYFHVTNKELRYAKWTGSAWSTQTVDSAGDVGMFPSIALDSSNHPHISYYDSTNKDLKYAKWTGSAWSTQTVDSAGDVGALSSIALDSSNNPHISYIDATNRYLKHARWTGDTWVLSIVDSQVSISSVDFGYTSIALDSSSRPHISYYRYNPNGYLMHAVETGNAWDIQTVDSGTISEKLQSVSIALDSFNNPHISYYHGNHKNLKYARWNGSAWDIQKVDSTEFTGLFTTLALDSSDSPHISYLASPDGALKYTKLQPQLSVSPDPLSLNLGNMSAENSYDFPELFSISNSGGGTLKWSISSDQPWIVVNPINGNDSGNPAIKIYTQGLRPGAYSGNIIINSNAGDKIGSISLNITATQELGKILIIVFSSAIVAFIFIIYRKGKAQSEEYRAKMEKWEKEGYDVSELKNELERKK